MVKDQKIVDARQRIKEARQFEEDALKEKAIKDMKRLELSNMNKK